MAKVWLSVAVLLFVQNVFANHCNNGDGIRSCDECIRCKGSWCSQIPIGQPHCSLALKDDFCEGKQEQLTKISVPDPINDKTFQPAYTERTNFVGGADSLHFTILSPISPKVSAVVYNATQGVNPTNMEFEYEDMKCDDRKCSLHIVSKVSTEFCKAHSRIEEYIYVKIKVENMTQEAIVKYNVPCACECSKNIEYNSIKCSKHGDFACNDCKCHDQWSGPRCSQLNCPDKRGDVQCTNTLNGLECSGNGYCNSCETCTCDENKEGSQYFDHICSDICMETSRYEDCIVNNTMGLCDVEQNVPMTMLKYDEADKEQYATETDDNNKKIWIRCNDTFSFDKGHQCNVEYLASRNEAGYAVVVVKTCVDHIAAVAVTGEGGKVSIILGVLGLIAVVAAVGGVMLWKHLNAAPAVPFLSPNYQNIDAEDSVGQNPIYIPPTTTFTNPQYGKGC